MFGNIPKETLAEILLYLSEKEKFSSLKNLGTISPKQLREAFRALAAHIQTVALEEALSEESQSLQANLKKPFQEIIEKLPKKERERLLRGFLN